MTSTGDLKWRDSHDSAGALSKVLLYYLCHRKLKYLVITEP